MRATPVIAGLVAVALCGCSSYRQSKQVAINGGLATGAGLAVALVAFTVAAATSADGAASYTCGTDGVCPVAARVGVVGALVVPVGAIIALGGLIGMGSFAVDDSVRSREAAPAPPVPPRVEPRFWCQRDSGVCTNDQGTCGSDCLSANAIWCAPYTAVGGGPGLLCGLSKDVCVVLAISDHNRVGREDFGECVRRTEPLPGGVTL